jgi:hypothetical protein
MRLRGEVGPFAAVEWRSTGPPAGGLRFVRNRLPKRRRTTPWRHEAPLRSLSPVPTDPAARCYERLS